ncbi:hypothetical protein GGF37_002028 [Kickxella alabastrina]|nr:hypothetical protein GGF37_002028 [Kickxella alabastrina]
MLFFSSRNVVNAHRILTLNASSITKRALTKSNNNSHNHRIVSSPNGSKISTHEHKDANNNNDAHDQINNGSVFANSSEDNPAIENEHQERNIAKDAVRAAADEDVRVLPADSWKRNKVRELDR